jgi:hypothetical protein
VGEGLVTTIPRIIHYVWCGPRRMPEAHQRFVDGWKRLHPDWQFMEWNDETIDFSDRWLAQAYVVRRFNVVSDYVRVAALLAHGGVYLDTDVELLKPLDPLVAEPAFLGIQTDRQDEPDWLNGAVIGAPAGHMLMAALLDALRSRVDPTRNLGSYTGPGLITETVLAQGLAPFPRENVLQRHTALTLFPTSWFYPYPWNGRFDPSCVTPDTAAIHHWEASWGGTLTRRKIWADRARRLLAYLAPLPAAAVQKRRFLRARASL